MWHLLQQQYFAAVHRGLHLILLVIPAALPSAAPVRLLLLRLRTAPQVGIPYLLLSFMEVTDRH